MSAMEMYKALLAGVPYPPPGVQDTPESKATWQRLAQELDDMPAAEPVGDLDLRAEGAARWARAAQGL